VQNPEVVQVAAGDHSTCALTKKGETYCWGENQYGQLGDGTTTDRHRPVRLSLPEAVEIGAGNYYGCARLASGSVSCWGSRAKGSIGDGSKKKGGLPTTPTPVLGLSGIVRIAIDAGAAVALSADGSVFHWGIQTEAAGNLVAAVLWPELKGVLDVHQSFDHGCALSASTAEIRCWSGHASLPILGSPTIKQALPPGLRVPVPPVRAFCARSSFTCAAVEAGAVYCWGSPIYVPTEPTPHWEVPTRIDGLSAVTAVACEVERLCALHEDRTVSCFGENGAGQLGDGTKRSRYAPRPVVGLADVVELALGSNHTCAVTTHGAVHCWGANDRGQLGDGTVQGRTTPAPIRW
jgi:alpha-tubulin suppressor-like RCC1 family protein